MTLLRESNADALCWPVVRPDFSFDEEEDDSDIDNIRFNQVDQQQYTRHAHSSQKLLNSLTTQTLTTRKLKHPKLYQYSL